MNFTNLGWSDEFARSFEPYRQQGFLAGRLTLEHKQRYAVVTAEHGEIPAVVTGKLLYEASSRESLPVVGDWVVVHVLGAEAPQAIIHQVLPRVSRFSRQAAGRDYAPQPVAANIDLAFLLLGLDGNYNLRRLERLLLLTHESGAQPVVLLTKADLCSQLEACLREVATVANDAPVYALSTLNGQGLSALDEYLRPGRTVALLGSSGVGKSTLLNHLLGQAVMRTQAVREDDSRGRHTTTHRQLFMLPTGACLIDTPGMRELQLWGDEEGLDSAFPEIEALARHCHFADCRHQGEPGCAVQAAVQDGTLGSERLVSYQKLQRELQYLASKTDRAEAEAINRKWKQIRKTARELNKQRGG